MLRKRCRFFASRLLLVAAEAKHSAEAAVKSSTVVTCMTKTQFVPPMLNTVKSLVFIIKY